MENFEFKSQVTTSVEQSKRLLELGLKKETADMTIHIKKDDFWYVTAEPFYEWEDDMNTLPSLEEPELIIPAWSLHRLMEIGEMRDIDFSNISKVYDIAVRVIECRTHAGLINPDYLEEKK